MSEGVHYVIVFDKGEERDGLVDFGIWDWMVV